MLATSIEQSKKLVELGLLKETPFDAAYKKIVWLLENKLIKTEEK